MAAPKEPGPRQRPPEHGVPGGTTGPWTGNFEFEQPAGSNLELREFSVRSLEASHVDVEKCAVGKVRGGTVGLNQSAAGATLARDVSLTRSAGGLVVGGKVIAEQSGTQWLVGGLVQARNVFAITVIAARVEGQVKCLFDTKGAFAFGAGIAVAASLLRVLLRR